MLKLKSTAKAVTVEYIDGRHTSMWLLDASLKDDELVEELRRIVAFYDAQAGKEPLPERIPGRALAQAQTTHPAPPGNGWAAMVTPAPPVLPEDRQGEWEMIPPEVSS